MRTYPQILKVSALVHLAYRVTIIMMMNHVQIQIALPYTRRIIIVTF